MNEGVNIKPQRRHRWQAGYLGPMIAVAVTIAAFWMFHRMSAEVRLSDIQASLSSMPASAITLSILATAISYCALASYDVVACRIVAPGKVPWRHAALSGMAGYAFSNFLGFHLLTGGAVRFRTYARSGLAAGSIGQVVLLTWSSLWLAFAAIVGLALILDPGGIALIDTLHQSADRNAGFAILAALACLFFYAGREGREIRILAWKMPLPGRNVLLLQLLVGVVDVGASVTALYVLLPADAQPGPALYLIVYITALIAGAVSHLPGGVGVFEATLIAGLGLQGRADVLASLLTYRLIYYFLPFVIAAALLAAFEAGLLRTRVPAGIVGSVGALKSFLPPVAAAIVFVAGIVLLFSGATPGAPGRLEMLEEWLPLSLVESSHFLGSLLGLALLVISFGLRRRLFSAWAAAVAMLVAGAALSVVKGLDWEEALTLSCVALFLVLARKAFYRRTPQRIGSISWEWLSLVVLALAATIWLGFFSYSRVEYSNELFWQFAWNDGAPRFLRASVGLVIAVVTLGIFVAINRPPARRKRNATAVPETVAALLAHSPDTQSNVALLGDKEFLWSPDRTAFLMYARAGRSLVSMGDPVGDPAEAKKLVWQFRDMADREAARAAFYGVKPDTLPLYLDMGYALLKLGEVARVDLASFSLEGPKNQGHRYADRRAAKEGLIFELIPRQFVPAVIEELREVSDAWLASKRGREKGFSLGRFDPAYLAHFDCAVMRREGRIVAFANIWRSSGKNEMSVDLMRYSPGISKVLMDALFVRLLLYAKAEGYLWFNLGAAPLSGISDHALASRWSRMARFVFRHGEDFYHFEGLRSFKEKFSPVWTPVYLACPGGLGIPQVLLDVNALISGRLGRLIRPGRAVSRGAAQRVRAFSSDEIDEGRRTAFDRETQSIIPAENSAS